MGAFKKLEILNRYPKVLTTVDGDIHGSCGWGGHCDNNGDCQSCSQQNCWDGCTVCRHNGYTCDFEGIGGSKDV